MNQSTDLDLLEVQSRVWREGTRISLEALVEKYPTLSTNVELLLDLLYNEILLREELGERPTADDYEARFPHLAPQLGRQFEVHRALGSAKALSGQAASDIPEKIVAGRYESTRFHKEGGLGFVFLAHDRELNRAVALKCMKRAGGISDPLVRRFLQEAEITSHLEHPSIVPVHGSGVTSDGRPYYAMRFVDGQTLEAACKKIHSQGEPFEHQGVEFRRLLRALIQVCEAVAYAHSKRILHRDLKPANIMLGMYGEALVLDWGLAKSLDQPESIASQAQAEGDTVADYSVTGDMSPADLTVTGRAKGSPAFMSPEQARGDWNQVGFASDVYSLGATLHFLLTGKLAFSATKSQGVLKQVGAGEFQPPRSFDARVPAALSAITCKAMALHPENRYATPKDLAKELERWMADEPVTAYPDSAAVRAARWARRHRTLVATCIVGLLVASIGVAVGAWRVNVANLALSKANESESKQRALANQRFSEALDDQVRLVTDIQSELSKAAGTRTIRERLVKEAMTKLQKLIVSASEVEDAEMAMISAHLALGTLYEEVDFDLAKAEAEATIAASQAEALQQKQPAANTVSDLRVKCLLRQFYILIARGEIPDAKAKLQKVEEQLPNIKENRPLALARWGFAKGQLAQTKGNHPAAIEELEKFRQYWQTQQDSAERSRQLSLAYSELGELKYFSGKFGDSVNDLARALELQRQLIEQEPANILYQLRAASLCEDLGSSELARTRHAEAEKYFGESIRLSEALASRDPDNIAAKLQLADAQFGLACLVEDRGKLDESLRLITAARKISGDLVKHDERSIEGRAKLAHYLFCEGRIRQTRGKIAEAAAAFDESAKMQRELLTLAPQRTQAYADLADVLRDLAELRLENLKDDGGGFQAFAEAQVELDRLTKIDPTNLRWQSMRFGNLIDIARWKQIRQMPGVDDAIAASMRKIAALPAVVQKSPQILNQIAFFQHILAESFIRQKRFDEAKRVLTEELTVLEGLKEKMPEEAFVWRHLRALYGQVATVCDAHKDTAGAIESLRKSVAAGRELERRFPDYDRQNQDLPQRLEELADRLVYTQPLEALKLLEEAIASYDEIVPEVAARFQYQLQLGVKRLKVADLSELMSGDQEATIERYRNAAEHFARCTSDDPQQAAIAMAFQAWSCCAQCERLLESGKFDEAKRADEEVGQVLAAADIARLEKLPVGKMAIEWRKDYQDFTGKFPAAAQSHQAIEMLPMVQRLLALQSRVGMLVSKGELAEAANSIDWLAENGGDVASISYKSARMYGTLYTKSNPSEAKYRDCSIELLAIAIKQGYFKEPGNKALAQLAPEFRTFSDTPEFKKLFEGE